MNTQEEKKEPSQNHPLNLTLRDVKDDDLPIFYGHQQEPEAVHMAAFTHEDPSDKEAFNAHWTRIRGNKNIIIKTIEFEGEVVGHLASFKRGDDPELTYWIGKEYWGKGIATEALRQFLEIATVRPMYGRSAKDNIGSIRVLEKCGFKVFAEEKGFANARGKEIEELVLVKSD